MHDAALSQRPQDFAQLGGIIRRPRGTKLKHPCLVSPIRKNLRGLRQIAAVRHNDPHKIVIAFAVREQRRIIPTHRFSTNQNGINPFPVLSSHLARGGRGNPLCIAAAIADAPVERHRQLNRHIRETLSHMLTKRRNQIMKLNRKVRRLRTPPRAFDSVLFQHACRTPSVLRIGINFRIHNPRNPGRRNRVRAGADTPRFRTRFQRHVNRRAARRLTAVFDGRDFRMITTATAMPASTDDLAFADDDRTNGRIGTRVTFATPRQSQRQTHVIVVRHRFHAKVLAYLSSTPFTSVRDFGDENQFARSIASLMTTALGTSVDFISQMPIRSTIRSTVPRR